MAEHVQPMFDEQIMQLLTISRELFEGEHLDAAFYALKAAGAAAVYSTAQADAVLHEARYQLSQPASVQLAGAFDVTRRDYIRLLHEVKTRDEFLARYVDYLKQHGMSDEFLDQEGM